MTRSIKFCILIGLILAVFGLSKSPARLTSDQIMSMVNADRARQGLPALELNSTLNLAAYAKAEDMISNHYFAHTSPEGVDPWHWFKALGYNYTYAGENLAIGYQDASVLENSWMHSPSHRANILSPNYQDMGLAIIQSSDSTLVVQMFGSPHKLSQK